MSGIFSVIIWIIIMAAVSGILKGKNSGPGTKDRNPYNKNGSAVPRQDYGNAGQQGPASQSVNTGQQGRGAQPVNAAGQNSAAYTDYSAGTVQEKHKRGAFNGTHQRLQEPAKQEDMSTTDYLRQKAVLDEADHLQDKHREEMRARWETGGLPFARRLYEGDSVPQGMRVIKCSYCGAENLVPQGGRQKYSCYFCREEL